jgi:serine-type D-Ala-D-Ala carboxypeptidase/endopeptidase
MRFQVVLALLTVLGAPVSAQFPSDSDVRAILRERVDSKRSSGIVVGLLEADGRTRVIAYNERAHGEPVFDARSIFEIGSITKAFTGSLLADMVARGEVKLDDPIAKYLPAKVKVPSRGGKQITLYDLATQSSGLPRLPTNFRPTDANNPYAHYTVEDLYAFLSNYDLPRDIGAQYEYSNLGVGLLGHVLTLRAGKSYEALVKERILDPIGMKSTAITLTPDLKARLAPGHNMRGAVVGLWDLPTIAGAGALRSDVEDMLKFLAVHIDSTRSPLSKRVQAAIRPLRKTTGGEIGLAWQILPRPDGRKITWHNGGTGGYRTYAGFDQKNRRGVVVLTNSAFGADDIGMHLLDPSISLTPPPLPPEAPPLRKEITLPAAVIDQYLGEYEINPTLRIVFTREGDKLIGEPTGQQKFTFFAETETGFFLKELPVQIRFVKDARGVVTGMNFTQNGSQTFARKLR